MMLLPDRLNLAFYMPMPLEYQTPVSWNFLRQRYLTAREQHLRERRRKVMEKLDVDNRLKMKEKEIEQLENKKKHLKQLQQDIKQATESMFET